MMTASAKWDAWHDRQQAAGLCIDCGRNPPRPDRLYCWECCSRFHDRYRRRNAHRARRVVRCGLCGQMGHDRRVCRRDATRTGEE